MESQDIEYHFNRFLELAEEDPLGAILAILVVWFLAGGAIALLVLFIKRVLQEAGLIDMPISEERPRFLREESHNCGDCGGSGYRQSSGGPNGMVPSSSLCKSCKGTGRVICDIYYVPKYRVWCSHCSGSGKVKQDASFYASGKAATYKMVTCGSCSGSGEVWASEIPEQHRNMRIDRTTYRK